MPPQRFARVTRWFLYLLVASIAVGALLAIVIVLAGNWSWFETRVLLTTAVIAAASVSGMACGAAMSRIRALWLPGIGIGLAFLGAALVIAGMWVEVGSEDYWRWTAAVAIFAVSSAHVALLAIARLQPSHRWVQLVAYAAIFLFALILVSVIFSSSPDDAIVRVLAVVGIVDAAFTLLVPVVNFLDRRATSEAAVAPEEHAETAISGTDLGSIDAEIAHLKARIADLERQRRSDAGSDPGGS